MKAQTDSLTALLNRETFCAKVKDTLNGSEHGSCHALMMLDIDGFKQVNDLLGHAAGDQVLVAAAKKLRSIVRRNDLVSRIGGDEFMVFLWSSMPIAQN